MFNTLRNGIGQPPTVSTDKVVPLGLFDDSLPHRYAVLYSMFLFDDVLDVSKLRNSLESLVERDGWRKLGARLRCNQVTGGLEHHIPAEYTGDRPGVKFYVVKHHMARADHPVASQIPVYKSKPAVMEDPNKFQAMCLHPDIPTKLHHYLQRDEPQLGLIVVSFNDATLVSLTWPHLLFDALGLGELLRAWSLMLQGRSNEISKPHGVDQDPLADLGRHPTEPYKLDCSRLSWLGHVFIGLRSLFERFRRRQQCRMIYVPAPFLWRLREKALRELANETWGDTNGFLSEGDVLCAWWAQVNVAHLSRDSNKLVNLANAFGWRPSLANDMLPSNRPYISNAVGFMSVLVPLKDIFCKPLGYVAWQIRKNITESRKREQVEAFAALWRKSPATIPPLFGNHTMHIVSCTNWSKAKFFELDFSAAIAEYGTTFSSDKPGRPSYVQSCIRGLLFSNLLVIIGKDSLGGYWLTGFTNTEHWASIEKAISQTRDIQIQ